MRRSTGTISIDENIYRPILDGFREGHDARDVLTDALIWWESELDAVDVLVAGRHHSKDSN
jgi:hypothetical protein